MWVSNHTTSLSFNWRKPFHFNTPRSRLWHLSKCQIWSDYRRNCTEGGLSFPEVQEAWEVCTCRTIVLNDTMCSLYSQLSLQTVKGRTMALLLCPFGVICALRDKRRISPYDPEMQTLTTWLSGAGDLGKRYLFSLIPVLNCSSSAVAIVMQ